MVFQIWQPIIAFFIVEQLFMFKLGTYPYRLGIPIFSFELPEKIHKYEKDSYWGRFTTSKNNNGDTYCRAGYPPLCLGPIIFVGVTKKDNPKILKVLIGPMSALFLVYIALNSLWQGSSSVSTLLSILLPTGFFFYRFIFRFFNTN
jgi:hypothetical protein